MGISLRALLADDFAIIKKWITDVTEFENLLTDCEHLLCWVINYDKKTLGIVYIFHINRSEKSAYWNYCLEKEEINLENVGRVLELNIYDYMFDVLELETVYCNKVCFNNQYCVTENEWNAIRFQLSYEKINYDLQLKPHHIGYAVANLKAALKKYRKLGYYQTTKIFDDVDRNIQIVFLKSYVNDECIELISPLSGKCTISGVLRQMKNVSSPYHICYETEEFERAIMVLKQRGFITTTKPAAAIAFNHKKVIFMMSKDAGLIELVEK